MKKILFLISASLLLLIISCSSYYRTTYYTKLLNPSNSAPLHYQDSILSFEFIPVANGIYFSLRNMSNVPAFLLWDRSYFIEPNGNSSKALNIDLLEENAATRDKAKFESTIPPNAIFARFTSSALNMHEFESVRVKEVNEYFIDSASGSAKLHRFYSFGRYWPEYKPDIRDTIISTEKGYREYVIRDEGLKKIVDYVRANDNMGLGLCIRYKDNIIDYRFDFRFQRVDIIKVKRVYGEEKKSLYKHMTAINEWNWQ